jgi:hypothetical protein
VGHDERVRLAQMTFQGSNAFGEFFLRDQAFRYDPVAKVVNKLQENWLTAVIGSVNMDQRIDSHVDQACVTQHAGDAPADVQIHSFISRVGIKNLYQPVPRWYWRIADMRYPIGFVQGNDPPGPHQSHHLGNNCFRFRNIYQNQAGRRQIERLSGQFASDRVPMANLHIVYSSRRKKFASELDGMIAQFDSYHRARRTDPTRQQFETSLGTTADLDYSGSLRQSDPIKELGRFLSEFLGLPLQASLLSGAVAQKVLVVSRHRGFHQGLA